MRDPDRFDAWLNRLLWSHQPGRSGSLHIGSGPTSTDEATRTDDVAAADEHIADRAGDDEALVGRVVARVVEVGGVDRAAGGRVEQDDVGVATDLEGALVASPNRRAGVVARRSTIRSMVMRPLATPSL